MIRLQPGARLGPYEIITLLGAGGMGRVYRARDTRLGRDVALKVLPPEVSTDPERRQRFEYEARTAGALNHPNIVAVYDVGSEEGISYIITELVEGEPLRERLENGPLTARDATDFAAQIADALSSAHAASIVHRDLKPENVMITRAGIVKLLDFGLARHLELPRAVSSTITAIATRPGMILGTVAYMSPEQVRGVPADQRSDIFSFGSVFYEMVADRRAFSGETAVETLTAIMKREPPSLPESVSPGLARIVTRCMEKNPENRFQSARDLAFAVRSLSSALPVEAPATLAQETKRRSIPAFLPWALCAALAVALLLALIAPPLPDFSAYSFRPVASGEDPETGGVWSLDGRSIAYVATVGFNDQVFAKGVDAPAPVQLTKLAQYGASAPFWSADGNRVYFLWQNTLWSVARVGGDVVRLFPPSSQSEPILGATLSPDGKTLALWKSSRVGHETKGAVWLSSPPGSPPRKYVPAPFEVTGSFGAVNLGWAPDGSKLMATFYRTEGPQAWILPFPDGGDAEPRRVFEPLLVDAAPSFSWFPDSRNVALALVSGLGAKARLWLADTEAETAYPMTAGDGRQTFPAVSPDGKQILYTSGVVDYDLLELPLDGSEPRPLVATRRLEAWVAWSPVAAEFVYITDIGGEPEIRVQNSQTHREHVAVSRRNFPGMPVTGFQSPAFSPDGMQLAFAARASTQLASIWTVPVTGGVPSRLTTEGVYAQSPNWSPDGKWIAHIELRYGRISLVKTRLGSNDPGDLIVQRGCEQTPAWSPAGDWILCSTPDELAIVSPDGKQEKMLGSQYFSVAAWSKDGSGVYAARIENGEARIGRLNWRNGEFQFLRVWPAHYLVSLPIANTGNASLSADGRSIATTVARADTDLWLMEGFDLPSGVFDWLPWRRPRIKSAE